MQTEMIAAGSSRRTEERKGAYRSGQQPELGNDWQRDAHNPGAAERFGVRIVDESQMTPEEKHKANRRAQEKYNKRTRGLDRRSGAAKKRRRWETKKDLELQKENLRRMTAPEMTSDAGNRREEISSGYATPEEEMPMTPREAPPSPPTNFSITRIQRDIPPEKLLVRVDAPQEEEEEQEKERPAHIVAPS